MITVALPYIEPLGVGPLSPVMMESYGHFGKAALRLSAQLGEEAAEAVGAQVRLHLGADSGDERWIVLRHLNSMYRDLDWFVGCLPRPLLDMALASKGVSIARRSTLDAPQPAVTQYGHLFVNKVHQCGSAGM